MNGQVINIPSDKEPLDVLKIVGERVKNSWLFLNKEFYVRLAISSNHYFIGKNGVACMKWNAKEDQPEVTLFCDLPGVTWGKIRSMQIGSVAYMRTPDDPINIYFLKMGKMDVKEEFSKFLEA